LRLPADDHIPDAGDIDLHAAVAMMIVTVPVVAMTMMSMASVVVMTMAMMTVSAMAVTMTTMVMAAMVMAATMMTAVIKCGCGGGSKRQCCSRDEGCEKKFHWGYGMFLELRSCDYCSHILRRRPLFLIQAVIIFLKESRIAVSIDACTHRSPPTKKAPRSLRCGVIWGRRILCSFTRSRSLPQAELEEEQSHSNLPAEATTESLPTPLPP
jgi:hypothetical protein